MRSIWESWIEECRLVENCIDILDIDRTLVGIMHNQICRSNRHDWNTQSFEGRNFKLPKRKLYWIKAAPGSQNRTLDNCDELNDYNLCYSVWYVGTKERKGSGNVRLSSDWFSLHSASIIGWSSGLSRPAEKLHTIPSYCKIEIEIKRSNTGSLPMSIQTNRTWQNRLRNISWYIDPYILWILVVIY